MRGDGREASRWGAGMGGLHQVVEHGRAAAVAEDALVADARHAALGRDRPELALAALGGQEFVVLQPALHRDLLRLDCTHMVPGPEGSLAGDMRGGGG